MVGLVCAVLVGAPVLASSYPQVAGGPHHTGVAVGTAPADLTTPRFAVGTDQAWRAQSAVAVGLGKVVGLANDVVGSGALVTKVIAISESTGQITWTAQMDAPIWDGWASPAIDLDNGVVVVAAGTEVAGFDIADGSPRWVRSAKAQMTFENASPMVDAGVAYVAEYGGGATLYAIDVLSGDLLWEQVVGTLYGAHTPTLYGDYVLMATYDGRLRFFSKQTGAPAGDITLTTQTFGCGVTVVDGAAYLVSMAFWAGTEPTHLYKVNLATRQVDWSVVCVRSEVMPVVTDDLVIVSGGDLYDVFSDNTDEPGLWAFDRATGAFLWRTGAAGGWSSQPVYAGGIVYVPSNYDFWYGVDSILHVFDVRKTPADPGFDMGSQALIANSVAVANGNLYGTGAGGLMAFGPALMLPGDINNDGYVNVGDLQMLVAAWGRGPGYAGPEDLNGDGHVNVGDLQNLVASWGASR